MKSIAVFCGSANGHDAVYHEAAFHTGRTLAQQGIQVVYGGARIGLMGAVADGALQAGGMVTGVLPYFLQTKEVAHDTLTDLIIVETMHQRKLKMHELSDGIITLPGGWGTMEELFEMLTWAQLGLHTKPIGLLNIDGYYDDLIQLCNTMQERGFLAEKYMGMLLHSNNLQDLMAQMQQYTAPVQPKWLDEEQS